MGYPTRVQLINRKDSKQWYINLPAALALACDFSKGEVVEWVVRDKYSLVLERKEARSSPEGDGVKKTP
jgi:hypothetical protein